MELGIAIVSTFLLMVSKPYPLVDAYLVLSFEFNVILYTNQMIY